MVCNGSEMKMMVVVFMVPDYCNSKSTYGDGGECRRNGKKLVVTSAPVIMVVGRNGNCGGGG